MSENGLGGRKLVLTLYVIVVGVATGTGFLLGAIGPRELDPELFGVIQLPPTPLGMAVYGGVTIGLLLGVLLLGVVYVSDRYVEEA
ncbi:DUF7520 family protein [Natronomonas sp. EA1]|uniref:DUF7520 family protein n=1 Tax=Natronomonas sp. EA1 TaxID=3421655 RepID=UPI003EBFBB00